MTCGIRLYLKNALGKQAAILQPKTSVGREGFDVGVVVGELDRAVKG